jgi:hypothetical protein
MVALNAGAIAQCDYPTYELLHSLKNAGIPDEEIDRAQREIEERGQTVFEFNEITDAGLENVVYNYCEQART